MKKTPLTTTILLLLTTFTFGQNIINFNIKKAIAAVPAHAGTSAVAPVSASFDDATSTSVDEPKDFDPSQNLQVIVRNNTGTIILALTKNGTAITTPPMVATPAGEATFTYPSNSFNNAVVGDKFSLTITVGIFARTYDNISSNKIKKPDPKRNAVSIYDLIQNAEVVDIANIDLRTAIAIVRDNSLVYDNEKNVARLVVGPDGELLSLKPVNVDENDQVIFYVICPNTEKDKYRMSSDGSYKPSDLSETPFTAPTISSIKAQGSVAPESDWDVRIFTFPPNSSVATGVTFTLKKIGVKDDDPTKQSPITFNTYNISINKFYNVEYAVSVVSSGLSNPTYKTAPKPGSTDKTIISTDDGDRAIFTFNVIWYWKSSLAKLFNQYKGQQANYFQGRDRLKEPSFFDRLNPSFGCAISEKVSENFFIGGVFEFARGGSIAFGGHYGKVTRLYNPLQLGQTFVGADADIITTKEWHWNGYIGITLDTRIFNKLISLGQ